jgi:hypothetical protein
VRVEALLKRDERSQADMAALQASLNAATAAVNVVNANAQAIQAVTAAATASAFKPNPPPRYENKDKDMEIRKWLLVVEDYARTCAHGDYLRTVSFYLHGKPRSYFQSKYDAYKAANGGAEPANPQEFFRETMIGGYGLSDQSQFTGITGTIRRCWLIWISMITILHLLSVLLTLVIDPRRAGEDRKILSWPAD